MKYTATVQPPVAAAAGSAIPTGTVTFLNGSSTLGAATLVNGKQQSPQQPPAWGSNQLPSATAAIPTTPPPRPYALLQTVLQTGAKVPLLLPTLASAITIPAEFLKGDFGNATVTLTNGGGAAASGKIDVNFYLSPSGSPSIPPPLPSHIRRCKTIWYRSAAGKA